MLAIATWHDVAITGIGIIPATVAAIVAATNARRGRTESNAAHVEVATAVVNTHNAVARVAEEIAPAGTVPVVEPVVPE